MEVTEYNIYIVDIIVALILLYYFSSYIAEMVKWREFVLEINDAYEMAKCIEIAKAFGTCSLKLNSVYVVKEDYAYGRYIGFPIEGFNANLSGEIRCFKEGSVVCEANH